MVTGEGLFPLGEGLTGLVRLSKQDRRVRKEKGGKPGSNSLTKWRGANPRHRGGVLRSASQMESCDSQAIDSLVVKQTHPNVKCSGQPFLLGSLLLWVRNWDRPQQGWLISVPPCMWPHLGGLPELRVTPMTGVENHLGAFSLM